MFCCQLSETFTHCHPYYTQQLGYYCYDYLESNPYHKQMLSEVIQHIIELHDNDYDRLWNTLNKTDKRVLVALATDRGVQDIELPTSTVYSSLKRLAVQGYLIKNETYLFDDPFFKEWITGKRSF
ncbi:MAG: hypothetical protein FWD65_07590 [Coriobacteriia bacterium]|nr:hypothetical protein [Coriobacteriia bacterium]